MSKSYIKIITATLIFSFSPLVIKLIPLGAVSILWAINFIGVLFLSFNLLRQKRLRELVLLKKRLLPFLALGVVFTVNNVLFLSSIKITTIANAIITHYLAPIFLVLLGILFLKERIERISVVAIIISLVGVAILLSPNDLTFNNSHFLGLFLGTLSAIFFASEIIIKKYLSPLFDSDIITICYVWLSVIFLLPFVSFSNILSLDNGSLFALISLGVFVTVIGIPLFIDGIKGVRVQDVGVLSYIEPLGAILWGSLFISKTLPLTTFLGGALILGSGYLIIRKRIL
jgi:RarD protein